MFDFRIIRPVWQVPSQLPPRLTQRLKQSAIIQDTELAVCILYERQLLVSFAVMRWGCGGVEQTLWAYVNLLRHALPWERQVKSEASVARV